MTCIDDDGILRAWLDRQLSASEWQEISQHLNACSICRARADKLRAEAARTRDLLGVLNPSADEKPTNPAMAYSQFTQLSFERQRIPWLASMFSPSRRPLWGAAACAIVVVLLIGVSPVRSLAQRILAMLRVEKIAVVTIDPSTLANSGGPDSRPYKLINQFLSDNVIVTMDPGRPAIVSNASQAQQLSGLTVRTIGRLGAPQRIAVNGETAFQMTLDRDRLNILLGEVGRSDIQIPESANGALIAVHIPKAVVSTYGDCPLPQRSNSGDTKRERAPSSMNANCTYLVQAPSPTVSVPRDLNMADIAEAALQLLGMTPDEARSFCQTVDWSSTLVVPIPRNTSSYQTVAVDGVEGTLVSEAQAQGNRYSLLWVKGGVIHALAGPGNASDALDLAASLR